jgi:hypothetical protein
VDHGRFRYADAGNIRRRSHSSNQDDPAEVPYRIVLGVIVQYVSRIVEGFRGKLLEAFLTDRNETNWLICLV